MPSTLDRAQSVVAEHMAIRARFLAGERHLGSYDLASGAYVAPEVPTVEDVLASMAETTARAETFRRSPRGRFVACIDELEEVGFLAEAAKLRTLYNSSITLLNGPDADQAAVGEAILVLNGIGISTAREGIDALAELLVAAPLAKAA